MRKPYRSLRWRLRPQVKDPSARTDPAIFTGLQQIISSGSSPFKLTPAKGAYGTRRAGAQKEMNF
jgi:hypothetical protein